MMRKESGLQRSAQLWSLIEIVSLGETDFQVNPPLQLYRTRGLYSDHESYATSSLVVVGGFSGVQGVDSQLGTLFQRAFQNSHLNSVGPVHLIPIANPTQKFSRDGVNSHGVSIASDFKHFRSVESKTIARWVRASAPKAVLSFTLGKPELKVNELCDPRMTQKLHELSELDTQVLKHDASAVNLAGFCSELGVAYIEFTIDSELRDFHELSQRVWRTSIGPALKWLLSDFHFHPQVMETYSIKPEVVPVVDLPPEFANL